MRKSAAPTILRNIALLWLALTFALPASAGVQAPATKPALQDILNYISTGWDRLTRTMTNCRDVKETKTPHQPVIYFPAGFTIPTALQKLTRKCPVHTEHLPKPIKHLGDIDSAAINPPGLLYLPEPYVVPGGMFDEMYGWDSYFIIRGLLRDGHLDLARGMVENFFFETNYYGGVLNANRTYFLTRSQPPFLTSMIMAVYDAEHGDGAIDRDWLAKAYDYALIDHSLWAHPPHLAGDTGLSRYYGLGEGPAPELGQEGPAYYRSVIHYYLKHPETADSYLQQIPLGQKADKSFGPQDALEICKKGQKDTQKDCESVADFGLTPEFYRGDRSMRESGFDVSFRFGPYGAGTEHYAPVGLNSLLYKEEKDLERISSMLGRKAEAGYWHELAEERREFVNKYLWDADRGLYFDYNFENNTRASYVYATTFYPLWVGMASPEQARAVEQNLKLFEQAGGLAMSTQDTGAQWDYPYGWAPIQLLAVEGLRRYGFDEDANRISYKFLSMVLENFQKDHTIREKYNVVTRSYETHVVAGYSQNVVGFGWTNGTFLVLLHELPKEWADRLRAD